MLTNILLGVIIILILLNLSVLIEFYRVVSMIKNIEIVAERVADEDAADTGGNNELITSQSDVYRLKRNGK